LGYIRFGALIASLLHAQAPLADTSVGEAIFRSKCAACHIEPSEVSVPDRIALEALEPGAIVKSLIDGNMRLQGTQLTRDERIAVAEFVTGRLVAPISVPTVGRCAVATPRRRPRAGTTWNGWGPDSSNSRFQAKTGGLTGADISKLRLRWAFGIPGATQSRSQPAIAAGRLFIGSQTGDVYALDAESGCVYWSFKAEAGVRTAISVGRYGGDSRGRQAIYFADATAVAYAVDATTGQEIWRYKLDHHPAAQTTGAPTLHDGRLYVPTSGPAEETGAALAGYECCTFRGSLTALDAKTGIPVWKAYTVPEPQPRGKNASGVQLWGPAGVGIWSAPTIDPKRRFVYAATGNAYAAPEPGTSDAIVAFSMATGAIQWSKQLTPGDIWIYGCDRRTRTNHDTDNANCPESLGPDFDFAASPALVTTADGRDVLIVTQKSGVSYALDPDQKGKVLWEYRWGRGSPIGGVWGAATDGVRAYFAVADRFRISPGGLHAVNVATGERVWYTPAPPTVCRTSPTCGLAQSAAVTLMPGIVFSGSADGGIRAYSTETGEIVWTFDTNRSFDTVNGIPANGGSIDGPGVTIAAGMLYVTAGSDAFSGMPGNVLLAFSARAE
jgi:polyvinyl alcohol dehydrogenase (cytochrome)